MLQYRLDGGYLARRPDERFLRVTIAAIAPSQNLLLRLRRRIGACPPRGLYLSPTGSNP